MYVATGYLRADGKVYQPGERVPAESWKTRRALESMKRIKRVPDDMAVGPAVKEDQAAPETVPTSPVPNPEPRPSVESVSVRRPREFVRSKRRAPKKRGA